MYFRKIGISLFLILAIFTITNVHAQPSYNFYLTDSMKIEDSILKPGASKEIFTLGEEEIYLFFEINNLNYESNLEFIFFKPTGEKFLNLTFNIPDPTKYGILSYPWIRGYIRIPIMGEANASTYVKIYYYDKISYNLPRKIRISENGTWMVHIYDNGKTIKSLVFKIKKLNFKVDILNRELKPIGNVNVRIVGMDEDYLLKVKKPSFEIKLSPGTYNVEIYKFNILVFNKTVSIGAKDVEYTAICNVTDLIINVVDSYNNPLQEATVILEGLNSIMQNTTDANGQVIFRNLPFHKYQITVIWYNVKVGFTEIKLLNITKTYYLKTNVTSFCVKVVGEKGQNLENARVTLNLPKTTMTLLTDDNGYVFFRQVPVGNWTLIVEYKNLREEIIVNTGVTDCLTIKFRIFMEIFDFILPQGIVYDLAIGIASLWILLTIAIFLKIKLRR